MKKSTRKKTDINVKLGRRLKHFRTVNGIPAEEMAAAFGIVKDSYLRIENGSTGLSGEYAYILATKFNCDMNYLFGGIVTDHESFKINESGREDDNERLAEMLHYIADIVNGKKVTD